ncbi:MAG TPA: hypothetical protein VNZ52_12590 [Candidatus Thermoplasmatota archaeon]|nr:hypothetical protein [Candidatus Thermoplasmatota archaeon]
MSAKRNARKDASPEEATVVSAPAPEAEGLTRRLPVARVDPPTSPSNPSAALTVEGNLTIAERAKIGESLHVAGNLRVGDGAQLKGPITALADTDIGAGVTVETSLDVQGGLVWGRGSTASSVSTAGAFKTADGLVRAQSLRARTGVRPATVGDHGEVA